MTAMTSVGFGGMKLAVAEPAAKPAGPMTRDQIDTRHKWDLTTIFDSDAAWEAAFKKVDAATGEFAKLKGTLGSSIDAFKTGLRQRDELFKQYEAVMLFAGLSFHEDMSQSEEQGRWDRVQTLGTKVGEATSWFTPEILAIDPAKITGWLKDDNDLAVYQHAMDDILRTKPHTLSDREENLLAMAGDITAAPGSGSGHSAGVGGAVASTYTWIRSISVFGLDLKDMPAQFEQAPEAFTRQTRPVGRIGGAFLKNFRLTMDPQRNLIWAEWLPGEKAE